MRLSFNTTMDRLVLIKKIRANRSKHADEHAEAVDAFWIKAESFARTLLKRVEAKDSALIAVPTSRFGGAKIQAALLGALGLGGDNSMPLPPPCHLGDYDKAINMIELHVEDTIELDSEDFARLVRDEWEWSDEFRTSYSALTG